MIVGTISGCDLIDTTPSAPNQLVMVIGECHYRDGPLIRTTEVHLDPQIEMRLFGPSAYAATDRLTKLRSGFTSTRESV